MNGYMGQIKGPFKSGQELIELINADAVDEVAYVEHIGIQTDVSAYVLLNEKEIEIGKTGIYEINDVEISSLVFKKDTDENTIIDYVVKLKRDVL